LENDNLKYQITALIDSEITDEAERTQVKKLIETDPDLKREHEILLLTKSIVQQNCKFRSVPEKLKQKIIKEIKPVENRIPKPLQFLQNIFSKPALAISGALALILIALILILNQKSTTDMPDLSAEQYGAENMFIQASNNFNSILTGKLTPQILTDNAENIKQFFLNNGVKYSTNIPTVKHWKILGAVVSEAGGEKFAHHVYSNDKGELIYLFQVDEGCLNKGKVINLSKKMMKYLNEGKCYMSTKEECTMLMKKMDCNICAIVSNASKTEIENIFCSLN
jgi:hypothetical protein